MTLDFKNKNWIHYLTRPFSLFQTSIWNEWYKSNLMKQLVGVKMNDALYIEFPSGNVRHYRKKDELDLFISSARAIGLDKKKSLSIMKKGIDLNNECDNFLNEKKSFNNLQEGIDFLIQVAIYGGVLPYFIGQSDQIDNETKELVEKLRSTSYYPKILEKIIDPLVAKELKSNGINDSNLAKYLTLHELISGQINKNKLGERVIGAAFVYEYANDLEKVSWKKNTGIFINEIEIYNKTQEIKGNVACRGIHKGIVRLIISNNIENILFDEGDILVAASTNPELVALMKKAGAIITDEGGITSHAAIISRELNIPCVIGTKFATQILKDGMEVEVDADNGIVKILK